MEARAPAGHLFVGEEPRPSEINLLEENGDSLAGSSSCKQDQAIFALSAMNVVSSTHAHQGIESRKAVGDLHERVLRLAQQCNYDTSRQVVDPWHAIKMDVEIRTHPHTFRKPEGLFDV
jgi:hypothetical protein